MNEKQNPFRRWKYKENSIGEKLNSNWDFMNGEYYFPECNGLVGAKGGKMGTVNLSNFQTECFFNVGFAGSSSRLIAPINFDEVEKTIKSRVQDLEQRAKLSNLPSVRNDPVAQKLEGFFKRVQSAYHDIWYAGNLPVNWKPLNTCEAYENRIVLENIASNYNKLVKRTMSKDDYELLSNSDFESFSNKCLANLREERKQKAEEEKRRTTYLGAGLTKVDNGNYVTYHDGKGGHWAIKK